MPKNKSDITERGYILITLLILLMILSYFGIGALNMALIEKRISYNQRDSEKLFYSVEIALQKAETKLMLNNFSPSCLLTFNSTNDYPEYPYSWWLNQTHCQSILDSMTTQYIAEHLATEPCAQIANSQRIGVDHYRVTAWASGTLDSSNMENIVKDSNATTKPPFRIIQSTYAVVAQQNNHQVSENVSLTHCTKIRLLRAGRESWRLVH